MEIYDEEIFMREPNDYRHAKLVVAIIYLAVIGGVLIYGIYLS